MFRNAIIGLIYLGLLGHISLTSVPCSGQENSAQQAKSGKANINTTLGGDGTGTIIVEARGQLPKAPVFYTASANANVEIGPDRIDQTIQLSLAVIQGVAETISFGINGKADVVDVKGQNILSWSVRQVGIYRYLDLQLQENTKQANAVVKTRSAKLQFPTTIELTHLSPGESVGFHSTVNIKYSPTIDGSVAAANGFAPLKSADRSNRFQSTTGGQIKVSLSRSGAAPGPVELIDTSLKGDVQTDGKSVRFQFRGSAIVAEPDAEITILSGQAAVSEIPTNANYRLRLATENKRPVYKLVFKKKGKFPVTLDFVAKLSTPSANAHSMDFTIAASAVVPLAINGLSDDLEFHRDQQSVVPLRDKKAWLGFLPATGRARLQWKAARKAGEGKLFFTSASQVDAKVGTGLLRQEHHIDYQVLQGELTSLSILLNGPGEILDVQGSNIVAWKVTDKGQQRQLDATLSQPITGSAKIDVKSQTPLGAFPLRVEGLRLNPVGAIRHSGFLRLTNLGSVRLEPTDLTGLTQLSPDQFPSKPIKARQVFVYRFPAADHAFTVAADRIQPEVNISELVLYQLAETDRVINADVELDIREAPIREWDFGIPADYSVVSVTGASVSDYIAASEAEDGIRNLKVIFGQDVVGRQLVTLHLEKNEPAAAGNWQLPRIQHAEAKTVRGNIGIIGAPGFRIAVGETDLLVDTPLSYFPKPMANLQQAFRIREPLWSATMRIELLERNVTSDVFHLYSLSQETVYGSALINYFVTGAPVSELKISVPQALGNVMVDGHDVRTWRRDADTLIVSLHQPVMGPYTLLVTFEEKPLSTSGNESDDVASRNGSFQAGQVAPIGVQGERGYVQIVSPMQVEITTAEISDDMLKLDPLELPAEFRLLSTAPPLGTWQYTERPFDLNLNVNWFQPGTTMTQVVEFSEANSRVSKDGELVTEVLYYVKSRGRRALKVKLPESPVRLWEATVNGQPVTARQSDDATLIPLPGSADPNVPVEVRLRLGKPTVNESNPRLALPVVFSPVLKTQWNITGDEKNVLIPGRGTVTPPVPVLRPTGFEWVAKRGIFSLLVIAVLTGIGILLTKRTELLRIFGLIALVIAIGIAVSTAMWAANETGSPAPLQLSLPILASGEAVHLNVSNVSMWQVNLSWLGLFVALAGIATIVYSYVRGDGWHKMLIRSLGILLIGFGVLLQRDAAAWFWALLALAILILFVIPKVLAAAGDIRSWFGTLAEQRRAKSEAAKAKKAANEDTSGGDTPVVTTTLLFIALSFCFGSSNLLAVDPTGFTAADSIIQQWDVTHQDARLRGSGTITLHGVPGDRFLLLKAPAVLTRFDGKGLRLTKRDVPGQGLSYVVSIPVASGNDQPAEDDDDKKRKGKTKNKANDKAKPAIAADYKATFDYQLEALNVAKGVPVLTGNAAVQEIQLSYDEPGWEITGSTAVRIESIDSKTATQAKVLLGPGAASLMLKPKARDVTNEKTQFFVEASNLYLPGPGVIDGRHRLNIRMSQGQVSELNVVVPKGLTVSAVSGPVGSWQFDADTGGLNLEIEPSQSKAFNVIVDTQRGLDPLPADADLAPLKVDGADGQVGLVAVAFGPDAQPEKLTPTTMSAVNLTDFDRSLITNKKAVLHRVYRYGVDGGTLALRVAPVAPEVRLLSKQVFSLGDERVVLSVNFSAEITRAGLFQLSFPLPSGLEVESLTGDALHHWAELTEGEQRKIILHLNGKTIGIQKFSLVLSGSAPTEVGDLEIPRFQLAEATRQIGELVVRPTTGIRLRTVSRQNVSETDARALGGKAQGALAFRLLQRDWNLVLGVEKLDPWVTGQVLHETTLREGQTRTSLIANFNVQNASIRKLQVVLPITDQDEIKTLRASGKTVSDFVRLSPNSDTWEVQFKRRVVGNIQFRIEYERRGDRKNESESLSPAEFPQARQLAYFFGVRAGGRLEVEHADLTQGWQLVDWNTVPQVLRESGNRVAPALNLRAVAPPNPLTIDVKRHSIADALKLRVANGTLTTVLSPTGDQLTAVDLTMEVIQRSSLIVGMPDGAELFSIFVNGESVHSIRQGGKSNAWQFYILPGIDDRTAKVRFVCSIRADRLSRLKLSSPELNVPLENIQWKVVAPKGYELTDNDGNLELKRRAHQKQYDRKSYLSIVSSKRRVQAQQASQLLEKANKLLQQGEQSKARWALNSVANQYALDAASNEDARVQLENLQTQQAIVGLNTRRQRLYLDNKRDDNAVLDNEQFRQAAASNPILQQDEMNFRPQQLSQLLGGNTTEDNAILQQIAARLVQHQRTTEPAPQAIIISLPEEGEVYTFNRSVQVAENAPLELDLEFGSKLRMHAWQIILLLCLLVGMAALFAFATFKRESIQ